MEEKPRGDLIRQHKSTQKLESLFDSKKLYCHLKTSQNLSNGRRRSTNNKQNDKKQPPHTHAVPKKKKDVQKAVNSLTDSSSQTMEPIMKQWLKWKDDNMILAW